MLYFWCWIFPPIAIWMTGKRWQSILNLILIFTVVGMPFAILWGYITVAGFYADERTDRLIEAIQAGPEPRQSRRRRNVIEDDDEPDLDVEYVDWRNVTR